MIWKVLTVFVIFASGFYQPLQSRVSPQSAPLLASESGIVIEGCQGMQVTGDELEDAVPLHPGRLR